MAKVITAAVFVVDVDATWEVHTLPDPSLPFLQGIAGGCVDVIRLGPIQDGLELDCWISDDGSTRYGLNVAASAFVSHLRGIVWPVYGPVVFAASNSLGDTVPLPPQVVGLLSERFTDHAYLDDTMPCGCAEGQHYCTP